MSKTKKPRYSPRFDRIKLQGLYEAELRILYAPATAIWYSRDLERFFRHFESYKGLEEFSIADVTDYANWRIDNGAKLAWLLKELQIVRAFWRWLIENKELPLVNPVKPSYRQDLKKRHALFMETKPSGKTFAEIETTAFDERSPIEDFTYYDTETWLYGIY